MQHCLPPDHGPKIQCGDRAGRGHVLGKHALVRSCNCLPLSLQEVADAHSYNVRQAARTVCCASHLAVQDQCRASVAGLKAGHSEFCRVSKALQQFPKSFCRNLCSNMVRFTLSC